MNRKRFATWGISLAMATTITIAASPLMLVPLMLAPLMLASESAATAPVIGMTSSQNGVTLDNSQVSGTATLFDGVTVQSQGYSRLHLNNGTRLDFAAGSKARVFANHAALSAGMTEMQSPSGFEIDTTNLKVLSTDAKSVARVKIDSNQVYVTALNSPVTVLNSQGWLVAKVAPGLPMAFATQGAAAMNSFNVTGCVLNKNGVAILDDETGHQVSELRGTDLRKVVGSHAHIVGTVDATATPGGGAAQVVKVSTATIAAKGGCSTQAAALGATAAAAGLGAAATAGAVAGTAVAAGAGVGIGTAAAVGVGVGAAAAASIGGAAAAGAFTTPSP